MRTLLILIFLSPFIVLSQTYEVKNSWGQKLGTIEKKKTGPNKTLLDIHSKMLNAGKDVRGEALNKGILDAVKANQLSQAELNLRYERQKQIQLENARLAEKRRLDQKIAYEKHLSEIENRKKRFLLDGDFNSVKKKSQTNDITSLKQNKYDALKSLFELKKSGILSDEEFNIEKKKILNN
jgi:hypothetical protein